MLLRLILFLAMVVLLNTAQAKIYKTVHEDGTVSYSDTPSEGAIEVKIKNAGTTISSSPVKQLKLSPKRTTKKIHYELKVLQPSDEQTIRNNSGNITITSALTPRLAGLFTLTISGKDYQSPTGKFSLNNMDRGEHSYQISFTDNTGKIIASTPQRKLYLHRISIINRPN